MALLLGMRWRWGTVPAYLLIEAALWTLNTAFMVLRHNTFAKVRAAFAAAGCKDVRAVRDGLAGTIGGSSVRYSLRVAPYATFLGSFAPDGMPFVEMHVLPAPRSTERHVASGRTTVVSSGDRPFDTRMLVEAAPADAARVVLDEATRKAFLALLPCELHVDQGCVTLFKKGEHTDRATVGALVALQARIIDRLRSVRAELEARTLVAAHGSAGYRGLSPEQAGRALGDELSGQSEIERLREVRRRRDVFQPWMGWLAVLASVLLYGVWYWLAAR